MKVCLILVTWFITLSVFAQPADSLRVINSNPTLNRTDSVPAKNLKSQEKKKAPFLSFLKKEGPEYGPKKAAFYSVIFPGGGQIYNRDYWKAPIALGAVGYVGFLAYDFSGEYRRFRDAYRLRVDGDPLTVDEFANNPNATNTALVNIRDQYRKWMEQAYIGFIAIYALNVVEAYTSAHLKNFDVSEDLTLHWQPTVEFRTLVTQEQSLEFGLRMQLLPKGTPRIVAF